ncbi:ABC-F family ATP-binding cassette domain-containing protein [Methyloceanibacter caenitepidi]|uniref:Glutathione-regulated potassium-efflux system ATP-binding protein n=1 Tax=Methyloceanibacter caenitepidi TaxID=1384459 RepID=A0A0A8K513_9HYPH|nr:ABC-F family ATP-binding cassette domain-containing protein [Methyloceanibacter caenitepidi]BAQ18033.1 glutathione-regulated potassium-efflux system ATP-binding protein [Methyloceanibacter caenitepidi]
MFTLDSITLRLGGHVILDRASVAMPPKARVGLVGRNGAGKSSLLKMIAGIYEADEGRIEAPSGTRIGYLKQDAPGGLATPFETVLAAAEERAALLDEADTATDAHRIAEIHERLNAIDAHGAPSRAARILAGLGFSEDDQHRPLTEFSGGWRMRVALAALLFSEPDLLLLDEPSNHLDLEAALWLESFLRAYPASLIVVSHERDMLNNVVSHIVHVDHGKTTLYVGNYDQFERQRHERQAQDAAMRAKLEAKRQKLQAYVDRWRYKAHTARQAQSRLKALQRMAPEAEVFDDASLVFDFPSPKEVKPPLMMLEDVAVGYVPGKPVLSHIDLRIDPDDRIALVGRNGNGKTTLARALAGQLSPMDGQIKASGKLSVGYFAQHQIEELVSEDTPLQHMERMMPEAKPGEVRAHLARFGFSGDKVGVKVSALSGGERARLSLALVTRDAPHILILDEPTNHLDVDAREALVQALAGFGGAVIVVSHDRHLLGLIADRLLLVDGGRAQEFDGTLEDYRDSVLSAARAGKGKSGNGMSQTEAPKDTLSKAERKEKRKAAADARERTKPLRKAIADAEADMKTLTKKREVVDAKLIDASPAQASELMKQRGQLTREIEEAEARWLEASEAVETAMAEVDA